MVPPIVHEILAHTALNPVQGMPFKWSLNPYKGCAHACSYCYARAYHAFLNLPASAFESRLFVKTNLPCVLRSELRRPSWKGEAVAIGTATDPYQPLEAQYRVTRGCLEAMADLDNPGSITTKGTLVTRDIDVLADLASRADFVVNISLVSLDRDLLQRLEPGAPSPTSRLRAVEKLSSAGVPVSLFLSPVLPGITDQPSQIEELVRAAAEHGARDVWGGALRLAPGVREHFLAILGELFPALSQDYQRLFALGAYTPTGYQLRIESRVQAARRQHGITTPSPIAAPAPRQRQLALAM